MKPFEFTGDWEFAMHLDKFMASNSNWGDNIGNNKNSNLIKCSILDLKTYDPDPIEEQLFSIQYLIKNQTKVLEFLCAAFDTINRKYGESRGEHDWYPAKLSVEEFGKTFFISSIEILTEYKDGHAYLQFNGEYRGDYEHGLIVVMHFDKLIGYTQIGEDVYKEIYDDLGEEGIAFRQFNIDHQNFEKDKVHQPLPKYGKLKPWQLTATGEYFDNLIRVKDHQKFMQEVETSNWDLNLRFPHSNKNLLDMAAYKNNIEIIEYLLRKGADASTALDQCMHKGFFYKKAIKCFVENGISIDKLSALGITPLCQQIKSYLRYTRFLSSYKDGDRNIEKTQQEIASIEDRIKFYISLGAKPNEMDKEGNDYKAFLAKGWQEDFLIKNNIYQKMEALLFPDKPKKQKWKLW